MEASTQRQHEQLSFVKIDKGQLREDCDCFKGSQVNMAVARELLGSCVLPEDFFGYTETTLPLAATFRERNKQRQDGGGSIGNKSPKKCKQLCRFKTGTIQRKHPRNPRAAFWALRTGQRKDKQACYHILRELPNELPFWAASPPHGPMVQQKKRPFGPCNGLAHKLSLSLYVCVSLTLSLSLNLSSLFYPSLSQSLSVSPILSLSLSSCLKPSREEKKASLPVLASLAF